MQSIRMLAALTGALVLGSACGGDDGGTGPNTAPVANFTAPACTAGTACTFTDASTDNVAVTGWDWDFGDGTTPHATTASPSHTYAAAGTYNVKLTVTDGGGLTGEKTIAVTVTAGGTALTAGFTYNCNAGSCTFTNTSTGTVASYAWDFGEPSSGAANQSDQKDPTHDYTVTGPTDFTVTLTVTDGAGATDVETQTVKVSLDLVCTGGDCTIVLSSKSTVTITVATSDCQFIGNAFAITEPIQEQVFANGCELADGTSFTINGGTAFDAGTNLQAQFTQGTKPRPSDPDPGPAATRVSGVFPDWTIEFDDGGNTGAPGEPDFNDIVLTVHATVVP
jgi:PKD repeat protein